MADPNINKKISEFSAAASIADTDKFVIARAGTPNTNLSVTGAIVKALASTPTPAGSDTQVQFNDGGVLGASSGMTFNKATGTLTVANVDIGNPGDFKIIAQSTAPAGFLKCNGAAISRTTYSALFAIIGTMFGAGDGSTTFNLPDLRGEFVRGWDDSRGVDSGRTLGSAQDDAFQGHTHSTEVSSSPNPYDARMAAGSTSGLVDRTLSGGIKVYSTYGTPRVAAETRPRNIALLFCIKY